MFGYKKELQDEIVKLRAENEKLKLRLSVANRKISAEIATTRLRQVVKYVKYKDWNNENGNAKAKSIFDDFHSGVWGSRNGMYVQIEEAIKFLEDLYCR